MTGNSLMEHLILPNATFCCSLVDKRLKPNPKHFTAEYLTLLLFALVAPLNNESLHAKQKGQKNAVCVGETSCVISKGLETK